MSHSIISTKEEEEITKPTTSSLRAATLLLSRVINPLKAGFGNCTNNFYAFLDIAEQYGNDDIRHLSTSIKKEVIEIRAELEVKVLMCITSYHEILIDFICKTIQLICGIANCNRQ